MTALPADYTQLVSILTANLKVTGNNIDAAGTALVPTYATLNQVGAAAGSVSFDRSIKVAKVALAALDTAGGVFAWANPEAGSIIITKVVLDVTTVATGACTVDIGTTTVSAATLSDNLIDGVDTHSAAVITDNVTDAGTNGKSVLKLATGKWVTGSMASGAAAGTVGSAYIHYLNA